MQWDTVGGKSEDRKKMKPERDTTETPQKKQNQFYYRKYLSF
jgi:hypothetical protein